MSWHPTPCIAAFQEHRPGPQALRPKQKQKAHKPSRHGVSVQTSKSASHQSLRRTTRLAKGMRRFESLLPLKDDAEKDLDEALPALHAAVQRSRTFESQYRSRTFESQYVPRLCRFSCHTCCTPRTFNVLQLKGSLLEQTTDQTHSGGLGRKLPKVDMRFACVFVVVHHFLACEDWIALDWHLDTLNYENLVIDMSEHWSIHHLV